MNKRLLAIRPLNLAFIALTQYLLFYHFFFPVFRSIDAPILLEGYRALLFLLATTLLTAGGYLINDLYDIETDRINKPGRWVAANQQAARTWVAALLLLGALLSAFLAWDIQHLALWFIYPLACFLLWSYSRYLKGLPFAGNLLVSILCMMVGGIAWFAEREGFFILWNQHPLLAMQVVRALGFYLLFAFLANLFREIVKDCQDVQGDAAAGLRTAPALYGLDKGRTWAMAAGILLALALVALIIYFYQTAQLIAAAYTSALLAAPLLPALWYLNKAREPRDFQIVSRIAKWIIFAGVFLILFFS